MTDIGECAEGTHNCVQLCSNTAGSFTCACITGYTLASDGRSCDGKFNNIITPFFLLLVNSSVDIDECAEGISGCSQTCSNTVGSYICSCRTGYRLASDNHGCIG